MTDPQLTVLMPAHNAETTIAAAIKSMLCQTYSNFELWILESNSVDRTAEVAKSFADPRVKVFELGSMGFQDALIYGLENAKTAWLARMDADDLSFPDRFKEQMAVIEQRPDLVLVGTQRAYLTPFGHIFEPQGEFLSKEVDRLSMRVKGKGRKFFVDASVIYNRKVALEVGGYDPEFQMGDVPLWFRLLSYGNGWEIAKPLYLYRLLPGSILNSQIAPSSQAYRIMAKYVPELLHLYPEEAERGARDFFYLQQKFWLRIIEMELLTGDRKIILRATDFLDRDGPFGKKARLIRWFAYLGRVGSVHYKWRKRRGHQHRPDWETIFTTLAGPLPLDQKSYSK